MEADVKYRGRIAPGSYLFQAQTGTVGYRVMLETLDGEQTDFVIWLKDREKAMEKFQKLGVSHSELTDMSSVLVLGDRITGRNVRFGTKEDDFNGQPIVKVTWCSLDRDKEAPPEAMVNFFAATVPAGFGGSQITDRDIPF